MHHAQRGVAVGHGVHQHAHGEQVVDLVERLVLGLHFFIDAVEVLGAAGDLALDVRRLERFPELLHDQVDDVLALLALGPDQLHHLVEALRVDVAQRQVLQLPFDGEDAQPVGQRRVDVERLARNGHLSLGLLVFEGAHVVQPVGQLDEHHADVLAHGQEHLAQGFGLLLLAGGEVQPGELRDAVHQQRHLRAELLLDGLGGDLLDVLHAVVQKPRRDGGCVQGQVGQRVGHAERMDDIGLARASFLARVRLVGKLIGLFDQRKISVRMVFGDFRQQIIDRFAIRVLLLSCHLGTVRHVGHSDHSFFAA